MLRLWLVGSLACVTMACAPTPSSPPPFVDAGPAGDGSGEHAAGEHDTVDETGGSESESESDSESDTTAIAVDLTALCMTQSGLDQSSECYQRAPTKPVCAASFDRARDGEACGLAGKTEPSTCEFPEGRCRCEADVYCGGIPPSFWQQHAMTWKCDATPAPGQCPLDFEHGAPCEQPNQSCTDGNCRMSNQCTCTSGRWHCQTTVLPPPP